MLAKVFLQKISCQSNDVLARALFYLRAFDLSSSFKVLQIQQSQHRPTELCGSFNGIVVDKGLLHLGSPMEFLTDYFEIRVERRQ